MLLYSIYKKTPKQKPFKVLAIEVSRIVRVCRVSITGNEGHEILAETSVCGDVLVHAFEVLFGMK